MPGDTHTCASCGDGEHEGDGLSCNNPCGTRNRATCELLPSQISNFTLQFFGPITKTDDGMGNVTWQLPCGLDVGLPSNPRAVDEGLACYFLRLFATGVAANQGPQGPQGVPGTDGMDAFSVTVQNFVPGTSLNPAVQLVIDTNTEVFFPGLNIFIQGAGYYLITDTAPNGVLFCQLVKPSPGVGALVPAGALVVPAGPPGVSIPGPQGIQGITGPVGIQGIQGIQGPVGPSFPITYAQYIPPPGASDFPIPASYAAVNFGATSPQILLTTPGVYLVTVNVGVTITVTGDLFGRFKLYNVTSAADITGSEVGFFVQAETVTQPVTVVMLAQTTQSNQLIALYATTSGSTTATAKLLAAATTISLIRLS